MGMDVYGNNGSYFRASIWQWRAIIYAMELAEYDVPHSWSFNDGEGLSDQKECDRLTSILREFMTRWDGEKLILECEKLRIDDEGKFVDPNTEGSRSPYWVEREHLQEFVDFLSDCNGFEIH